MHHYGVVGWRYPRCIITQGKNKIR
jgi:hypothetical protein